MGVRTYYWGPQAWIFIHTCSEYLDRLKNPRITALFWFILPRTIPCIHCRTSCKSFIQMMATSCMTQTRFSYLLHQEVNLKLFEQDIHSETDTLTVVQKWVGHQPQYSKMHTFAADSNVFRKAMIDFFYYVVCDYELSRHTQINELFMLTATVLKGTTTGDTLYKTLQRVGPLKKSITLQERIQYIYDINSILSESHGDAAPLSPISRRDVCEHAIVGCVLKY